MEAKFNGRVLEILKMAVRFKEVPTARDIRRTLCVISKFIFVVVLHVHLHHLCLD